MDALTLIQIGDSTIRLAIPLLLACLAGLFSERAGIFDIGLEGKMLAAAFMAAAVAFVTSSAWLGLAAAVQAAAEKFRRLRCVYRLSPVGQRVAGQDCKGIGG